MPVEGGLVVREAAFVLDAAFDVIEHNFRQAPLGHAVQVFDVDGVIDAHVRIFPIAMSSDQKDRRWRRRSASASGGRVSAGAYGMISCTTSMIARRRGTRSPQTRSK